MKLEQIEQHLVFGAKQTRYRHYANTLNSEMTFTLFLPENPNDQVISLIWWLSGLTCTDQNFSQKGQFQRYANEQNVAIIMPDTSPRGEAHDVSDWDLAQGASFYVDATQDPYREHYQMYTYLTEELPELVYPLIPNYSGKESIMGHSMGGHGALMIGLKNPERFMAISAFAPITNPSQTPWGQKAFEAYLGDKDWASWDATSCLTQATVVPPMLITQGSADEFYEVQLEETNFVSAAKAKEADLTYQKVAGYDHSYYTIATFIEEHLKFHKQYI